MAIARPPARTTPRPARTPSKQETARVEAQPGTVKPPAPATSTPATSTPAAGDTTSAPIVRASVATAPMPTTGEPPLGLRYTILKINPDNSTSEVAADTVFHSGDRIRFAIEPNASGYLYIINQGSSGTWKPMFPSPEIEDGNNKVEGFHPYTMPPKSRLAFDTNPGTENLFIVFSRQPEPDLEQLIYSLQGKRASKPAPAKAEQQEMPAPIDRTLIMAANIDNPLVDRLRNAYSRDLIVEKVDANTPGDRKETAIYVVNPTGSRDSRVVADLHLVHQ
ncbi:MAG: DUF4384 domain-containing protein [Acidobacteria bacterium]|nr:DUF4384 domain-containing protein [Acidobacteriota bacterium]